MSLTITKSRSLYEHAKQVIPGGTQLLSKRPEMFAPDQWPAYFESANGCEIVDLDGNRLLDMSLMGIGSCLLGYADPDVTEAVVAQVRRGSMCTLNSSNEVPLADLLLKFHPWAEQVRFLRTGGEAMSAAVRIARAATKRTKIAFCGYHGWHDWYLAANRTLNGSDALQGHLLQGLSPEGVPSQLADTAIPFAYNDVERLKSIAVKNGHELAAVVMEPTRNVDPTPEFIASVKKLCSKAGAVLIVDEITAGWRFALGGAHLKYGLEPDIAVFAKALGNGHPIAAVLGRRKCMSFAQESFISSTYWTESVGPTAALATLKKFQQNDMPGHLDAIGREFRNGLLAIARETEVPLRVIGHPALTSIVFDHPEASALQTLFTVRMLDQGILAGGGFYPSLVHTSAHVLRYLTAAQSVLADIREAIKQCDVTSQIGGPVRHTGFVRLT